jgi:hypothetical protein
LRHTASGLRGKPPRVYPSVCSFTVCSLNAYSLLSLVLNGR